MICSVLFKRSFFSVLFGIGFFDLAFLVLLRLCVPKTLDAILAACSCVIRSIYLSRLHTAC